ncbi:TFIIB-type zinc ribbon-containing protein [Clostridium estertheticum]|uniref:TFIIB-type zinc ribbon-containing protein n=1 Tax=Clostridium estertheticum TaxID=238834 RepID=UPI001C6F5A26|nr:TFIIB-type zinc ribbon-containing protein [Clostridium estertheticum]MBW9154316.1 TFIIB-type zinc ribbon-containing protein [Clostridium estertheticum]WLC86643.1 TFIIB-type zinc ribbon-containing protein [Clostridium estertheticum]
MSDIKMKISIPADNDGFILFQCPLCGEFFKLKPSDYQADDVIEIWCPGCGLKSKNYLTKSVIDLAMKMAENVQMDMLFKEMKNWEHQLKNSGLTFNAGKQPNPKSESPIIAGIEALEINKYDCCKRVAKIKPIVKLSGGYCPFCGVN